MREFTKRLFLLFLLTANFSFFNSYLEEGYGVIANNRVKSQLINYNLVQKPKLNINQNFSNLQISFNPSFPLKRYKKKKIENLIFRTTPSNANNYDINGDGLYDYGELRKYLISPSGKYSVANNPFAYAFDINKNGDFEPCEILIDEKQDGWNGNEKPLEEKCKSSDLMI